MFGAHKNIFLVTTIENLGIQVYNPTTNSFSRNTSDLISNCKIVANGADGTLYMYGNGNINWINSGYTDDNFAYKLLRFNDNRSITQIPTDDGSLIYGQQIVPIGEEIYIPLSTSTSTGVSSPRWIYKLDVENGVLVKAIDLTDVDSVYNSTKFIAKPDKNGYYYFEVYNSSTGAGKVFKTKGEGKEFLFDVPSGFGTFDGSQGIVLDDLGFYLVSTGNLKSWIFYPDYKFYVRKYGKWCPMLEDGAIADM
jgi:hypothetical protein